MPKLWACFGTLLLVVAVFGAEIALPAPTLAATELKLGERDLTIGSWGADVFALQQQLKKLGYEVDVDGRFGQATWRAVLAFQQSHHLNADGVVGPSTALALIKSEQLIAYRVQNGDSLWSIAQHYDTSMTKIVSLNNLTSTTLEVGQMLKLPAPLTYTVKAGDTLGAIAASNQTTIAELEALNDINDPRTLQIGAHLRLPRPVES